MSADVLKKKMHRHIVAIWCVVLVTGIAILYWPSPRDSDASGVNLKLPLQLGNKIGFEEQISEAERIILPADTEFARKTYRTRLGDQVLVSIVLSGSDKRSIHRPEICLPGQGWIIKGGNPLKVQIGEEQKLEVMNLFLERQIQTAAGSKLKLNSYYMYWFVGSDMTTSSHLERVLVSMWDRIFKRKNHRWAYVIVSSTITEGVRPMGKSAEDTQIMLEEVIKEVAPLIHKDGVLNSI